MFVVKDGRLALVRPRTGPSDADRTAIMEGISEGDEVVVGGLAALSDGVAVRVAGRD